MTLSISKNTITFSKKLILALVLSIFTTLTFAQENKGQTITVTIDNVKNNKGNVLLGLHDSKTFMRTDALQNAKSKIENNKITVTFTNVKPGEYAIMAVHDENENNRMDYETNGMPKESYGMSNNTMSFGPPQFADAKFKVTDSNLELNIRF